MKRHVVIKAGVVDPRSAMWIRANVLSRKPSTRPGRKWEGPDLGGHRDQPFALIDVCRCMYGPCGHCSDLGKHDNCAHRLGTAPPGDGHETWVISSARGAALAPVWIKQVLDGERQGCRWVCPCEVCAKIGPPLIALRYTEALPKPRRIVGPLKESKVLF